MAEISRERVVAPNEQKVQDEVLTRWYTPRKLLEAGNTAAVEHASLPSAALAERAVNLCNFNSELNQANCLKAFPVYEQILATLPSTVNQIDNLQKEREVTQEKWGQQIPLTDDDKKQYWQKLDLMRNAVDMRFSYGVTLNHYGFQFNDEAAKAKGIAMLAEASQLEPKNYEFAGALMQAKRQEVVDFQKAYSEGAVQKAVLDLPEAKVKKTSWKDDVRHWVSTKLDIEDPQVLQHQLNVKHVADDLQEAASDAPITTKEFIDKAVKTLDPESALILENAYKVNLR